MTPPFSFADSRSVVFSLSPNWCIGKLPPGGTRYSVVRITFCPNNSTAIKHGCIATNQTKQTDQILHEYTLGCGIIYVVSKNEMTCRLQTKHSSLYSY